MATLKVNNLTKNFAKTKVLKQINLEVSDGEFIVLLGPSGCGKSTLLNIIAGLESVDEGEIMIDEYVVNRVEPKDRNIAMVFQSYALYPAMIPSGVLYLPYTGVGAMDNGDGVHATRAAALAAWIMLRG